MPHKDPVKRAAYMRQYRAENYDHILELNRKSDRKRAMSKRGSIRESVAFRAAIKRESRAWETFGKTKEYKITQYHIIRQRAYKILGNKCEICAATERLEFHHLYYGLDSRQSKNQIQYEVLQHPQRFQLLCHVCHGIVTLIQNDTRGLEKATLILQRLVNQVNESVVK